MKFPRAQKGVNLLWIAALISIIVSVVAVIGAILTGFSFDNDLVKKAGLGVIGGAGIAALVVFILELIGLVEAKEEERGFRFALIAVFVSIILSIIGSIFGAFDNDVLKLVGRIFDLLSSISSLGSLTFIFAGIMNLAGKLNDQKMVARGRRLIHIIWFVFISSIVLSFVSVVLPTNIGDWVKILIGALALVSAILELVSTILTYVYYYKAKEMLKQ